VHKLFYCRANRLRCEVQFAYGLRGKRSRPVSERPKSFVSSSGKEISPAVEVAKKNEVRTKQGLVGVNVPQGWYN
jgi:hypothetical protein